MHILSIPKSSGSSWIHCWTQRFNLVASFINILIWAEKILLKIIFKCIWRVWCGVPIRYWLTPECVVTCSRVDCHEASDPVPTPSPGRHRASSLLCLRIHSPHVNHQHYKAVTAIMAWCHAGPSCEGSGSMSVQPQLCEASCTVRVPSSNQGQPHHQQILNHHRYSFI